ncbi:MAG: 16S rRNA (guanine(527)-N(7))-methyltransferase RsmG [Micromonosporaceae bacterium]
MSTSCLLVRRTAYVSEVIEVGGNRDSGPVRGEGVESAPPGAEAGRAGSQVPAAWRTAAEHYFGERLPLAERYADLLATDGVVRGLIGPREVPRIWDRHLLNSVALLELLGSAATVTDVGSGAGLPGLALAIARPGLNVVLVEAQLRRTTFLEEAVANLGLDNVSVLRARAEEAVGRAEPADVVVARAVAPLDRLVTWCLPLASVGGRLLALKGASAVDEIRTHQDAVRKAGGGEPGLVACGAEFLEPAATVIQVVREREAGTAGRPRRDRPSRKRRTSDR